MNRYTRVLNNHIEAQLFTVMVDDGYPRTTAADGSVLNVTLLASSLPLGNFDIASVNAHGCIPLAESCYPLTVTVDTDGGDPTSPDGIRFALWAE